MFNPMMASSFFETNDVRPRELAPPGEIRMPISRAPRLTDSGPSRCPPPRTNTAAVLSAAAEARAQEPGSAPGQDLASTLGGDRLR